MALANCSECGRLFNKVHRNYCPNCEEMVESYCQVVADYLYDRGKATISEINQNTGIATKWITKMIEEGRIEQAKFKLNCEICGDIIFTGKLCVKCANRIKQGLSKEETKEEKKHHPYFYTKS